MRDHDRLRVVLRQVPWILEFAERVACLMDSASSEDCEELALYKACIDDVNGKERVCAFESCRKPAAVFRDSMYACAAHRKEFSALKWRPIEHIDVKIHVWAKEEEEKR